MWVYLEFFINFVFFLKYYLSRDVRKEGVVMSFEFWVEFYQ